MNGCLWWAGAALALWLGGVILLGLLLFAYRHLEVLASRGTEPPLYPLLGELTGAFAAGLMFFPARWLVRRLPLTRSTWPRRLPAYLLMMLVRRRGTLREIEERLDPAQFVRLNRSESVRLEAIRELQPWFHGDARVILKDGAVLTWSRRYRGKVEGVF